MPSDPSHLFGPTLALIERSFRRLEAQVPPPGRKPWKDGFVYRYSEQSIQQAIVQKLARSVSGLYALGLLCENGLLQEQGVIQRTLDDLHEDVLFLALALTMDKLTPLHEEYLRYFYQEEFGDPNDIEGSLIPRGMVKRSKIRAYINRVSQPPIDPSRAQAVGRLIYKAYSGFVHAASPHIMDMYNGNTRQFDVSGLATRMWRQRELTRDAWNYFYRGLLTIGTAAAAFRDHELLTEITEASDRMAESRDPP